MPFEILDGEKAGDIKNLPINFASPKFDWRQMQRWEISSSVLPAGSTVHFQELTIWEQYSWQIALTVAVVLLQAGLILVLLREHRRRQLAEVQTRQRTAELVHVNRFATAGELTASIAHEINQPLGSILTNAETADVILQSSSPDIAELQDIVKDILRDDRRASEVIRRMRSLLKKAPFELKNFDLNDLVGETIELIHAVGRKVEFDSVITRDALPILGDRIQLQQVILNLVANGIDAMKDTKDESRIMTIRTSRVEEFAQLSVSDRGLGIPASKLKMIFEPFFTNKAEGMGMGLSIARTIIEAHNGVISARNRDHGGASFRIRLPLIDPSHDRAKQAILDCVLGVALQLLRITLGFLSGALGLHLVRAHGLADALFDLARGFVGDSGCLIGVAAHVESFHQFFMTQAINQPSESVPLLPLGCRSRGEELKQRRVTSAPETLEETQ